MNRLLAVVGLPGSGKSLACQYFQQHGFELIYFGAIVVDKLREENLKINEKNEKEARERLRKEGGMAVFAKLNLDKINSALQKKDVVIDGLYSWEEYVLLKENFSNLEVVCIYAPPTLRYKRLESRPTRPLNFEEARSRDYSQIENLHQAGPIAMADFTICNLSTPENLTKQLEGVLKNGKN